MHSLRGRLRSVYSDHEQQEHERRTRRRASRHLAEGLEQQKLKAKRANSELKERQRNMSRKDATAPKKTKHKKPMVERSRARFTINFGNMFRAREGILDRNEKGHGKHAHAPAGGAAEVKLRRH
jgi:hypothetical protein